MDEPALELDSRGTHCERLAGERFDLLVIGGGIVGAGIASAAATAGLAVALVDRGDFGAATSSASSKLIHGGLRYLRLGDVGLVREAHHERRLLMQVVAPHLVRRLPFVVPLYRGGPYRPATMQAGLVAYSALARARLSRLLSPERARELVPALKLEGLRSCGLYADAETHDGRLCLANVQAAARAGAAVVNYAEVSELRLERGRVAGAELLVDAEQLSVSARAVVNATGPWVDTLRRLEAPSATPSVRLSKGVHALLALDEPWPAALTILHDPVRVSFAVPWQGMLLLGTTDTLYEGEPDGVEATEADLEQILGEAATALEPDLLRRERVCSTFAGLRVLPGATGDTLSARRETVYSIGPAGMLTVAGGKLTTYRRIAFATLDALRPSLGLHRLDRRPVPLPGAAQLDERAAALARSRPELEPSARDHLLHLYGSLAAEVVAEADRDPELLRPLHPDGPDIAAQVVYARRREWAVSPDDVLRRRTTLALRGLAGPDVTARVEELLDRVATDRAR